MKPIKILHHLDNIYDGLPAWVILMSDDKEYISTKGVFVENTKCNVKRLIDELGHEEGFNKLFLSNGIEFSDVTDGRYMFEWCHGLTKPADTPLLTNGGSMYKWCVILAEPANTPLLSNSECMYAYCTRLTKTAYTPLLTNGYSMYYNCVGLPKKAYTPLLTNGHLMYCNCIRLPKQDDTPLLADGA